MQEIETMEFLVNEFSKFPGVGKKTAQRYFYHILNLSEESVSTLANAMITAKKKIHKCKICGNFTENEECSICADKTREPIICVVKEPKDLASFDKVNDFKGKYHILHGVLNPLEGKGPNDINLKSLLSRISTEGIKEVIVATNPDVEGEATALYIATLLKPLGVKVTRIAQGIAMGSELEYADALTLSKAIENRKEL